MGLVDTENLNQGTEVWRNAYASVDAFGRSQIEGYCLQTSVAAGETLQIAVNSSTAFFIDIYRLGYYGGAGARHMRQLGYFGARPRTVAPRTSDPLYECNWDQTIAVTIPSNWLSGVYLGRLTQVDITPPRQSYVVFVVRDTRTCDFLFKTSDLTWCAYNQWPGKYSLYDYYGTPPVATQLVKDGYWGPGGKVSYDRPYSVMREYYAASFNGFGWSAWMSGASQFLTYEYPLLFWLEKNGYDGSYMSCMDLHATTSAQLRSRAKALLCIGHDEYYTLPMYNNLKGAINAVDSMTQDGLSVAFFVAGSLTGIVEMEPSTANPSRPNRVFRRIGRLGPHEPWLLALHPEHSGFTQFFPDSAEIVGARLVDPAVGVADWVCTNTTGPLATQIYAGTGLQNGNRLGKLIGFEFSGQPPTRPGLETLALGNLWGAGGYPTTGTYAPTVYPGPKGNFVFNAATMWWSHFLNTNPPTSYPPLGKPSFKWKMGGVAGGQQPVDTVITPDPADMAKVERMTANVLQLLLS